MVKITCPHCGQTQVKTKVEYCNYCYSPLFPKKGGEAPVPSETPSLFVPTTEEILTPPNLGTLLLRYKLLDSEQLTKAIKEKGRNKDWLLKDTLLRLKIVEDDVLRTAIRYQLWLQEAKLLIKANLATEGLFLEILKNSPNIEESFMTLAVEKKIITSEHVTQLIDRFASIDYKQLHQLYVPPSVLAFIPEQLMKMYKAVPVTKIGKTLIVAMVEPENKMFLEDLKGIIGLEIVPVVTQLTSFEEFVGRKQEDQPIEELSILQIEEEPEGEVQKEKKEEPKEEEEASAVELVNQLLRKAVQEEASDIHFEPFSKEEVRVRFRVEGELKEITRIPEKAYPKVLHRIKRMGGIGLGQNEGTFQVSFKEKKRTLHLALFPSRYGETLMGYLVPSYNQITPVTDLGFSIQGFKIVETLLKQSQGVLYVVGPSHSGRTTTLYALLQKLLKKNKRALTIEGHFTYLLEEATQIQTEPRLGFTTAHLLRILSRQNPMLILADDLKDREAIESVAEASLGGHLVLGSLYGYKTCEVPTLLGRMGVSSHLMASTTIGIIAQRLVQKLCLSCRVSYEPSPGLDSSRLVLGSPPGSPPLSPD